MSKRKGNINRECAYETLLEIEREGAYSNLALNENIARMKPASPAFVRELCYGVLENKFLLDAIAAALSEKGIKGLKAQTKVILRMGLYELAFMEGSADYACVNESVELAGRHQRGLQGFVNAVLRGFVRRGKDINVAFPKENEAGAMDGKAEERVEYLSLRYSYSPWIIRLWKNQFEDGELEELLKVGNARPDLAVRANALKCERSELIEILKKDGIEAAESALAPCAIRLLGSGILESKAYKRGLFSVQDESSQLCAELMEPKEGEEILDLCAAPGGKSLAMAEKMHNKGRIIAGDIYEHRLDIMAKEAKRLGISIIEAKKQDAAIFDSELSESFDRVLCDVPCSGLGVVRRKPEIKTKPEPEGLRELPEKQLAILENGSRYLKKGGTLVYSTCTINRAENVEVTAKFLAQNEEFIKVFERQLLPHKDGCDGFYICKFVKEGKIGA